MIPEDRRAWLATLKPGDQVAFKVSFGRTWSIRTVESRTPSGWLRLIGSDLVYETARDAWRGERGYDSPTQIVPIDSGVRETVIRHRMTEKLGHINDWDAVSTEALRAMCAAYDGGKSAGKD